MRLKVASGLSPTNSMEAKSTMADERAMPASDLTCASSWMADIDFIAICTREKAFCGARRAGPTQGSTQGERCEALAESEAW